jgi:hypothetical protein
MRWSLFLLPGLISGCVGPQRSLYPPAPGEVTRTVYVVNHGGLHSGIAVQCSDIPALRLPASHDYPNARFLEIGWGDDDGYRKDLTTGIATKALVWSTRTVLLIDGFTNSVLENFDDPRNTIIEVKLSDRGFDRLCEHIERTFALDPVGRPIPLGNDWYRAQGRYCLFHTCNTWVAEGLRAAGCPITSFYCITRKPLLFQAGKIGRVIALPQKPGHAPGR